FRDDGFDVAVARRGAKIKIRLRLESVRELSVDGIRRLLVCALPTRLRALLLLGHRLFKSGPINIESCVASQILDKIARQSVSVIQPEGLIARISGNRDVSSSK